jgi:hypothetical protein
VAGSKSASIASWARDSAPAATGLFTLRLACPIFEDVPLIVKSDDEFTASLLSFFFEIIDLAGQDFLLHPASGN